MGADNKISAIIITYNEEKDIERCLKSVSFASEIIVVDSYSTDNTVAICKRYTQRVYLREFKNFSGQKNYALSLANGEWIFSIDADEEVTKELEDEIMETVAKDAFFYGYLVPRRSFIFNREFRYTGTQDDRQIRLFKKDRASFYQPIHEKVKLQGRTGALRGHLNHYTYTTLSEYILRLNRYTSMEAEFLLQKKYRPNFFDVSFKPPLVFLKLYFLKGGFRDGIEGLLFSVLSGAYVFVKYAKCAEQRMKIGEGDVSKCSCRSPKF